MDTITVLLLLSMGCAAFAQTCEESHLERCLKTLEDVVGTRDLTFATSPEDLRRKCTHAQSALGCATRYSRKCLPLEDRDRFNEQIAGSQKLIVGLCSEGNHFRKRYLEVLPCLKNASDGLQYCGEKYERNQRDIVIVQYEDKAHLRCCSFDGYRRCIRMVMELQSSCGDDPSDVSDEIVLKLHGAIYQSCEEHFEKCTGSSATRITPFTLVAGVAVFLPFYLHRLARH